MSTYFNPYFSFVDSSCFNGGTCTDKINGYSCTCRPGFTGSHCQYEVNECDSQPCLNGGICQDALESFRCSCPKGYTGNRCQVQTLTPLKFSCLCLFRWINVDKCFNLPLARLQSTGADAHPHAKMEDAVVKRTLLSSVNVLMAGLDVTVTSVGSPVKQLLAREVFLSQHLSYQSVVSVVFDLKYF